MLTHNDQIAFGLLLTLRQQGIAVPGEMSVVGYDDTRLAALSTIRLTSVSQDAGQLARDRDHPGDRPGRGRRPAGRGVRRPPRP